MTIQDILKQHGDITLTFNGSGRCDTVRITDEEIRIYRPNNEVAICQTRISSPDEMDKKIQAALDIVFDIANFD